MSKRVAKVEVIGGDMLFCVYCTCSDAKLRHGSISHRYEYLHAAHPANRVRRQTGARKALPPLKTAYQAVAGERDKESRRFTEAKTLAFRRVRKLVKSAGVPEPDESMTHDVIDNFRLDAKGSVYGATGILLNIRARVSGKTEIKHQQVIL